MKKVIKNKVGDKVVVGTIADNNPRKFRVHQAIVISIDETQKLPYLVLQADGEFDRYQNAEGWKPKEERVYNEIAGNWETPKEGNEWLADLNL